MKIKLLLATILLTANLQAQKSIFSSLQNEKSDSKQSVLIFYRPDCPYCLRMNEIISNDKGFLDSFKGNFNIILLDINSVAGKSQASLYNVKAVPTIVKLDNKTNDYKTQNGFNSTLKLADFLGINYTSIPTAVVNRNGNGVAVCGDGNVDGGEQCDDFNTTNGDGCSSTCQIENPAVCGDGVIQAGEQCDDFNTTNGDGCSSTCQIENPTVCGDGIIQAGEQCDDGNTTNGDGCNNICQTENPAVCGDGVIQAGEQCDDGNTANGDGCNSTCQTENPAVCGDGVLQAGEQCDDGNTANGDGCNNICQIENPAVCGDGVIQAGEQCDDANVTNGDGCNNVCQLETAVNDICATALPLTVGTSFNSNTAIGNTFAATTSVSPIPSCQTDSHLDTWYKVIVPASGKVTFETQTTTDTTHVTDSIITVYSGTCGGTLTQVGCDDDGGLAGVNNFMSVLSLSGQTPGTTLYVAVWVYGTAASNSGSFKVAAYDSSPVNDSCTGAYSLTVGGTFDTNTVIGSTAGATTEVSPAPSCQATSSLDTWYKVVVPASGSVTIETQTTADTTHVSDSIVAAFSGTCGGTLTQVGCDDDNGLVGVNDLMSVLSLTGQTPGATLYVGVWRYGTSAANTGTFKIAAYDASLANASFDDGSFSIYPNPVKDILNISYTKTISKVQVFSILGQEVISKVTNVNQNQIDMSALARGTYFVKVTSDGLVKTIKIIKE